MHALSAAPGVGHGWVGAWSPGIGDPTALGWITTVAYLLAAVRCWRAAVRARRAGPSAEAKAWAALAAGVLLLGINKQLDLQTALGEVAREGAVVYGLWRFRSAKLAAVIAVAVIGGALSLRGARVARGGTRPLQLAMLGAFLLVCYVVERATSITHLDQMIHRHWSDESFAPALEIGGIVVTMVGAAASLRGAGAGR